MRIGDVFSLAVAALIGLYTITLQPWSPQWWGGVAVAGTIALATGGHIFWNRFRGLLASLSLSRSFVVIGALVAAGAMLGFDYWYYSNYSTNGGLWHIRIGLPSTPPIPLSPPPKPPGAVPWVSQEEIAAQQQLGRTLLVYSPAELLEMESHDESIEAFVNKWIKVDYPVGTVPYEAEIDKKQLYLLEMYVPVRSLIVQGQLGAYIDRKKWADKILALRKGEQFRAFCQFKRITKGAPFNSYNMRRDTMVVDSCELF
jgi:hypothetical protein